MFKPLLPKTPWRDLRWWTLIVTAALFLFWLFLYFQQSALIVQLIQVVITSVGAIGIKVLYDEYQPPRC